MREELAKLLQSHRRSVASGFRGYECVCGVPLRSNSMQATSEHQSDEIMKYLEENKNA